MISNQGGISLKPHTQVSMADQKSLANFKTKCGYVFTQLAIPISIYAATKDDIYRKPRTGMWAEMLEDHQDEVKELDLSQCIFVGDAAGRLEVKNEEGKVVRKKDFASSDRDIAANIGIPFLTPEEFFRGEEALQWARTLEPRAYLESGKALVMEDKVVEVLFEKKHDLDIVMFCGSPGSGKSTFYWDVLAPMGYGRVNQDTLKTVSADGHD
jgi:bifunctional polynucleotide phosphatase/kinase